MKSKSKLLRIIKRRDLDLNAEGGLVQVIRTMIYDAGRNGLTFSEIADQIFPELDPDDRFALSTLLRNTCGRQLRQAEAIGFALEDKRKRHKTQDELLRIIEQRDLDLKAEGKELVQVILEMLHDDAAPNVLTFPQIADRLFPELSPAEREKVGTLLEETHGQQLRQAAIRDYVEELIEVLAELIEHYRLPIEVSIASIKQHVSLELGEDGFVLQPKTDAGRKLIEIYMHEEALIDAAEARGEEAIERPMTPRRLTRLS